MTTVAIMQPYFVPYAGYFRLFAAADVVVMFDCVQFPRRGWVHRNLLPTAGGDLGWLTLPLKKAPFDASISSLEFVPDARERLTAAMRRFPILLRSPHPDEELLLQIRSAQGHVTDYLCRTLKLICDRLALSTTIMRSTSLAVPSELRGQDRVIQIARSLGAKRYVNPPGGRALYEAQAFARHGIELRFFPEYRGDTKSILARILAEPPAELSAEIAGQAMTIE